VHAPLPFGTPELSFFRVLKPQSSFFNNLGTNMDGLTLLSQAIVFHLCRCTPLQSSSGRASAGAFVMPEPTEDEIKRRANELWEQAGCPKDRDNDFYHLAEQELRNEDKSNPLRTPDNL
jgi:hypothetical protein